ncbi:neuronal acetylcholine receptor subunit NtR [Choristoneura fumiferana]|uniref:neuronal acetylcholine receptor subunit NtR n=1 Tax=Choristoneura fumiferana TaxID=7141 RepID=UPI003D156F61
MYWRTLFVLAAFLSAIEADGNYTFSYHTASQCKEHTCRHGYKYETFYRIYSEDRRPIKMDANVSIEMHIAILAANNGHILLSTAANPNTTMPVYEIVVGGGGNKFTELRRNLRRNAKDTARTTAILSPIEFRPFYIKIWKDGLVEFGKEGESPILRYFDVHPIPVEYFSFAAWTGVEAKFLYDCPVNGSNSSTTDSQEVARKMSNSDRLKTTLLMDRLPHLPPGPTVEIQLGLKITSVRYNPFTSKLVTGVAVVASWVDESMAWNPDKFNNITRLAFSDGQIWRPTFFLINSEDKGAIDIENPGPTMMVNSGEATYYFQAELTTWCFEYAKTYNRWPHDEYRCSVVIGAWETHERIQIEEMSHQDEKMAIFTDTAEVIPNEWQINWKQGVVLPAKWHAIFKPNDNDTDLSDRFLINIRLKRKATAYNIVFYTPLTVLVLFVLMSFWSEPLEMSRIWFYAGSTIVICMGLCYIDYLVPCHNVPTILILYVTVLSGILIALLTQVLLMTSVAQRVCKSSLISSVLANRIFRIIFLLPAIKNGSNYNMINEAYSQEDDECGAIVAPRNGNVEEMETEAAGEREELASAIDKLMFVVYSVVFAVMLALHF